MVAEAEGKRQCISEPAVMQETGCLFKRKESKRLVIVDRQLSYEEDEKAAMAVACKYYHEHAKDKR